MNKIYRKNVKGQNILLIGGSGFIGSHLAEELLVRKIKKLVIIDNLSVGKKEHYDVWIDDKAFWSENFFRQVEQDNTREDV